MFALAILLSMIFAAAIARPVAPAVAAGETPRIQIVFDGSGSMWGRIPGDGGAKFTVAREALRQSLPRLARTTEVGLVLFGHRRRGDCSDVETALPLQPLDSTEVTGPLEKLNPKGRGPLALALMTAADAIPGASPGDSLVLIHDDLDNCQGNPCEVARSLHRVRPHLAIHVVSLGLKEEDAKLMSCVATITGGRSFNAQDAPSAISAIDEVLRLASLQVPQPVEAPREKPKSEPPAALEGPPGLRLSAVLAKGGKPLDQPIQFRVYRQGETSGEPLAEVKEARPSLTLAPGTYVVEARLGFVTARQSVEVAGERPTQAAITLDAGAIRLSSTGPGGGTLPPTTVFSLVEANEKEPAQGRVLWVGLAQDVEMIVPAGSYRIVIQDRQFRAERMIVVPAGSQGEPLLASSVGRVQVKALDHGADTDPAEGVLYRVLEDDPNARGGRREVARSAAEEPVFTLPAGTYHLVAEKGTAEVRELIALKGGDDVQRILNLKLGRLTLATRLPGITAAAGDVSYRVFRMQDGEQIARVDERQPRLDLPAGRYRVEARIGRLNAVASREIDIADGMSQEVVLEPAVARVQLRLAGTTPGHSAADVFWEVIDGSGRAVWRSMEAEPREFLAAGRYTVRAETRDRSASQAVDVRAGEARTLEVALD